ncbi:MAG: hypothetical protein MHPSP_001371 [Paramarteilia canceri]
MVSSSGDEFEFKEKDQKPISNEEEELTNVIESAFDFLLLGSTIVKYWSNTVVFYPNKSSFQIKLLVDSDIVSPILINLTKLEFINMGESEDGKMFLVLGLSKMEFTRISVHNNIKIKEDSYYFKIGPSITLCQIKEKASFNILFRILNNMNRCKKIPKIAFYHQENQIISDLSRIVDSNSETSLSELDKINLQIKNNSTKSSSLNDHKNITTFGIKTRGGRVKKLSESQKNIEEVFCIDSNESYSVVSAKNNIILYYPSRNDPKRIKITSRDLKTLEPNYWLNDTIIDFYIKYLCTVYNEKFEKPKVFAFSSFFYNKLTITEQNELDYIMLLKSLKDLNVFSHDLLIIPINEEWLKQLWCQDFPDIRRSFEAPHFITLNKSIPKQQNYSDCGIHVLHLLEKFLEKFDKVQVNKITFNKIYENYEIEIKRMEITELVMNIAEEEIDIS